MAVAVHCVSVEDGGVDLLVPEAVERLRAASSSRARSRPAQAPSAHISKVVKLPLPRGLSYSAHAHLEHALDEAAGTRSASDRSQPVLGAGDRGISRIQRFVRLNCEAASRLRAKLARLVGYLKSRRRVSSPNRMKLGDSADDIRGDPGRETLAALRPAAELLRHVNAARRELAAYRDYDADAGTWPHRADYGPVSTQLHVTLARFSFNVEWGLQGDVAREGMKDTVTAAVDGPARPWRYDWVEPQEVDAWADQPNGILPGGAAIKRSITTADAAGRLPLHHAVRHGLTNICRLILAGQSAAAVEEQREQWARQQQPPQQGDNDSHAAPGACTAGPCGGRSELLMALAKDHAGESPLVLAARMGHIETVRVLLLWTRDAVLGAARPDQETIALGIREALGVAVRRGDAEMVEMLLIASTWAAGGRAGTEAATESLLFQAAWLGHAGVVNRLLSASLANLDAREPSALGWTPLHAACARGHRETAEVLLAAGADPTLRDGQSWTALEHAAYRGHQGVVELLQAGETLWVSTATPRHSSAVASALRSIKPREIDRAKTHIFVTLGSCDFGSSELPVVNLDALRRQRGPEVLLDDNLLVEATVAHGSDERYEAALPMFGEPWAEPWHFTADDIAKVSIRIRLLNLDAGYAPYIDYRHIGSAVAVLDGGLGQEGLFGRDHAERLQRHHTIPIIGTESGDICGTLTFTVTIIRPFTPPPSSMPMPAQALPLGTRGMPTVIGHRGAGQNSTAGRRLHLAENTIASFGAALEPRLGAAGVEFDVQLTRDLEPVIYHDFLLPQRGIDAMPVHALSKTQFRDVVGGDSRLGNEIKAAGAHPATTSRRRASSTSRSTDSATMADSKGRVHIHAPPTTLSELLRTLPASAALDVEIKYPMLWQAIELGMRPYVAVELNAAVDAILSTIHHHHRSSGGDRKHIFFSSFSPDVCAALAAKQQEIPVLFLSDNCGGGGRDAAFAEPRAASLQAAVHFARRHGLAGVVLESKAFVAAPRLVKLVQDAGLAVASYGALNDEVECAIVSSSLVPASISPLVSSM